MTTSPSSAAAAATSLSMADASQIVISEDLKQAALHQLTYLKEFYDRPELLKKQAREYAVYRYETFWLPFLAENGALDIVPPLDVLFVWHSHMLAPTAYASDCERLFGRILPNRVRERTSQVLKFSEQLWIKKYARTMPYHLDYLTNTQVIPPYTSKIKYALIQAVERQSDFYYNVALSHYKDSTFLDEAVKRYKKFIYLKRLNPQLFVVPMYDIDIIWHTHQLFPEAYRRDMIANLQHVLHHDDTTQDRTANAKLATSDHETRHKWFELYGDRLPKNGCMYRGKTSKGFYQKVDNFQFLIECQRYTLYVQIWDKNTVTQTTTGTASKVTAANRASTIVPLTDHISHDEPLREQVFAQFNTSDQEIFVRGSSGHVEAHFEADFSDFTTTLVLKIQQKAGYWPMNYFNTVVEYQLSDEPLKGITQFQQPIEVVNNLTGERDPNGLIHLFDKNIESEPVFQQLVPNAKRLVVSIPAVDVNTIIVLFETAQYEEVTLGNNYSTQLGTSFLFNLENVKVKQALHSIHPVHQDNPTLLNIRHTIINDIDVFTATFNSAIYASCHTLNWSQIPLPEQVSNRSDFSVVSLNPETEEALIIKDHAGDWGIVKFSKDLFTASVKSPADAENEQNYQFVLYRFMPDGRVEQEIIFVDWEDEQWLVGSDNFSIEMNTWSISVKRTEIQNSMQYFCLASALTIRFDTLFTQIFGRKGGEEGLSTNGIDNDNDLLANETGQLRLNGTNGTDAVSKKKSAQPMMAMSAV